MGDVAYPDFPDEDEREVSVGGMLDFREDGLAGCVRCGYRGSPNIIDGVRSTYCPVCEVEPYGDVVALDTHPLVEREMKLDLAEYGGEKHKEYIARTKARIEAMQEAERRRRENPPAGIMRGGRQMAMDRQSGQIKRASTEFGGVKIGRNDPCPCGSGKKAKKCHPELT